MYSYKSMNATGKKSLKGKRTRERILIAGKKTFTRHPYSEASVRKMQKAGDFNYALIRYYFGSKKGLFEAVAMDLSSECTENALPLVELFSKYPDPVKALPEFIEGLCDFYFENPDGPAMIMLNIGATTQSDADLPGIIALQQYMYGLLDVFQSVFPYSLTSETAMSWVIAFSFLSANCIGAASFHAAKLGMKPDSPEYRTWVKEAVKQLFEPVFESECRRDKAGKQGSADNIDPDPIIPTKNKPKYVHPLHIVHKSHEARQANTKGEISRKKILEAARRVFTRYPYNTASIRKIGQEGGFDFTLVHHYFPTKRSLAEAVAENFYDDFFQMTSTWVSGIARSGVECISLYKGLASFIDHCVDFYFKTPSSPAMIMQNIGHPEQLDGITGFEASQKFYEELTRFMAYLLPLSASKETVRKWHYCLTMLINTFIGTPGYPAHLLKMDPNGGEYRKWVKQSLVNLFYPSLREMIATTTK